MKKIINNFYVGKSNSGVLYAFARLGYDYLTGEEQWSNSYNPTEGGYATMKIEVEKNTIIWYKHEEADNIDPWWYHIYMWDKNGNYLGRTDYEDEPITLYTKERIIKAIIPDNDKIKYIAFEVHPSDDYPLPYTWQKDIKFVKMTETKPLYKELNKKYEKDNSKNIFREKLDGKIRLIGKEYDIVNDASINDTMYLFVYQNVISFDLLLNSTKNIGEAINRFVSNNDEYVKSTFNKIDCKFNHFTKSVELKLTEYDKYNDILNGYENTYNLIELAPNLSTVHYTKRCLLQIYVKGEGTISNYFGGTYWEEEVNEQIWDENALINKYYFAKGFSLQEINIAADIEGIKGVYKMVAGQNQWTNQDGSGGTIYFTKLADKGTLKENLYNSGDTREILLLSTGKAEKLFNEGTDINGNKYASLSNDLYEIRVFNRSQNILYISDKRYVNDSNFILSQSVQYIVTKLKDETQKINLGDSIIEYSIWGRLLCDVSQGTDGTTLYDLPFDDFAINKQNFKKCIGIVITDSDKSVVNVVQNGNTSTSPTAYGKNDYGLYFVPPHNLTYYHYEPCDKSNWGNTSLWVLQDNYSRESRCEDWFKKYYKQVTLKDAVLISNAIKALLKKVAPYIRHEGTAEYSQFLYGTTQNGVNSVLNKCLLYITQKTNILKGEYDQPAQRADISLKDIFEFLANTFKCYWYIDKRNRLIIEHISFFLNGLSYNGNKKIGLDLTSKNDIFNNKKLLYAQQEISYSKSDLASRYEFGFSDSVTEAMGEGLTIDIKSKYVNSEKNENITSNMTSDLDFMLFMPDKFSEDGFAFLLADRDTGKVPIIKQIIKDEKQPLFPHIIYTQNYYASFNNLANLFMYDMSGDYINCDRQTYEVVNTKRIMEHSIEFQNDENDPDINSLIRTDIGDGQIENMSVNIDTKKIKVSLLYEPK